MVSVTQKLNEALEATTLTACRQSEQGETLNSFAGVAYTEINEIPAPQSSRSCPEYRSSNVERAVCRLLSFRLNPR